MWFQSLDQEDPLEKEMATHSSILAWKIPWTEEPKHNNIPVAPREKVNFFNSTYILAQDSLIITWSWEPLQNRLGFTDIK